MKIESINLVITIASIILTNIVLVLGAVWRISGHLSKIETQLEHLNEKHNNHSTASDKRLDALEGRILDMERMTPRR